MNPIVICTLGNCAIYLLYQLSSKIEIYLQPFDDIEDALTFHDKVSKVAGMTLKVLKLFPQRFQL